MKNWLSSTFLRGLSIIVPLAVALQIIWWLISSAERLALTLAQGLFPPEHYVPGMGLLLLLAIIFLVGLLMYPWVSRKLFGWFDLGLRRVPLFGSIYGPVKDLMDLFDGSVDRQLGRPVMVRTSDDGQEMLAFLTRESGAGLPADLLPDGHVVVYIQFSSQLGGYCLNVPASHCRALDISTEDALRWALTAGLSSPRPRRQA